MNTEEKPINNEYDVAKWKRIMDVTQNNYANMIKRLERRYKVSNYALIYYSIFLIIMTLTAHYFPRYFHAKLGEYFGVILSIVVLAYSLINNSANYSVRIADVERALNKIKTIKRELNEESIETCKKNYNAVTDATERRDDMDFFITVENLCKAYDISIFAKPKKNRDDNSEIEDRSGEKMVYDYLSEINVFAAKTKILLEYAAYILLFAMPVGIFILCVFTKLRTLQR
nr:MAG TPA: SMODS and SLOG-associating 2TM effector domain family 5 [Caudoviricetes sp.]